MRLKYDDTRCDQKFSESEVYKTPTKRLLIAWKRPRNEGVEITFREFLVRMGVIMFETHCIFIIYLYFSRVLDTLVHIIWTIFDPLNRTNSIGDATLIM